MKKLFTNVITLNGKPSILNFVEAPQSGRLDMPINPTNPFGLYAGADGQFYVPVYSFGNTFMDRQRLRDLLWHAIRNVQRNYNETDRKDKKTALYWTRKFHQLHTMLLGEYSMGDELTKRIAEIQNLDLLLEVMKEEQVPYKAEPKSETIWILGTKVEKSDLVLALRLAGLWFCWEAAQDPGLPFREDLLLYEAVAALYSSFQLGNTTRKHFIPGLIFEFINEGRNDPKDIIPMNEIRKMMKSREIPAPHKRARA